MIAKSSTNPVFLSARARRRRRRRRNCRPNTGSTSRSTGARRPTKTARCRPSGSRRPSTRAMTPVLISCSRRRQGHIGAINDAVARGVPVMTFDSDAPQSKRFAFYGVDDVASRRAGHGGTGQATRRQRQGRHPRRQPERAEPAQARARASRRGQRSIPASRSSARSITSKRRRTPPRKSCGHERLPGHHRLGDDRRLAAVHQLAADRSRSQQGEVVAVDALPAELPYVDKGIAPVLLAQPVYDWGYCPSRMISTRSFCKKDVPTITRMELVRVIEGQPRRPGRVSSKTGDSRTSPRIPEAA